MIDADQNILHADGKKWVLLSDYEFAQETLQKMDYEMKSRDVVAEARLMSLAEENAVLRNDLDRAEKNHEHRQRQYSGLLKEIHGDETITDALSAIVAAINEHGHKKLELQSERSDRIALERGNKSILVLLKAVHEWFMKISPENYNGCGLWIDVDATLRENLNSDSTTNP